MNTTSIAIADASLPKLGICGNCGDKADHPLGSICPICAYDAGLIFDTFPEYYYPSEFLFDQVQQRAARIYFIFGI